MILTIFLAIVFCVAITMMMFSAVAFIQDKKFFSSAPKEAQEALLPREKIKFALFFQPLIIVIDAPMKRLLWKWMKMFVLIFINLIRHREEEKWK